MEVKIIATGSSGNCVLVDGRILIDAGISIRLLTAYGVDPAQLDALIITHKHGDHMKLPLVRYLLSAGVKAFLPSGVIAKLAEEGQINITELVDIGQVTAIADGRTFQAGPVTVEAFPQQHHDIVNYAFVLTKGKDRLLYATDLDTLEPSETGVGLLHLGQFDTILLEGNYDEPYLRAYIEYMVSLVPEAEDPTKASDADLESWVKANYRSLPDAIARNAFRAIQNHRHLSKQQARAYAKTHLKPGGSYYEIHRSRQFYEEPEEDWRESAEG